MSWPETREDATQHKCDAWPDSGDSHLFGHAVSMITEFEGRWYAENGEYATVIRFCPFCGAHLTESKP